MRFVVTSLPEGSHLVRVCAGEGAAYDRMIAVTVDDDCLHLQGWIGTPLTPAQWRQAAAELFPGARRVRFERHRAGEFRTVQLVLSQIVNKGMNDARD
jgi:hypothetical protein